MSVNPHYYHSPENSQTKNIKGKWSGWFLSSLWLHWCALASKPLRPTLLHNGANGAHGVHQASGAQGAQWDQMAGGKEHVSVLGHVVEGNKISIEFNKTSRH